ncbi:MAG: AmmeMemoRadiSam system protein A [Candidatus Nanoarchaeia archaeon]
MELTNADAEKLLKIAREAIALYQDKKTYLKISEPELWMREKRATFVTLKIKNRLRGCIGHLHAMQELHKDVIDNAVASAFFDPRFPELKKEELKQAHIEISILTPPWKLEYKDADDLLKKLKPTYGVILTNGLNGATFLPQVWEELPNKEEFLTHLCMKAGLPSDFWKSNKPEIQIYNVEMYEEKK